MSFSIGPWSDEFIKHVKETEDQMRLEKENLLNNIKALFNEIDKDHLLTLRQLLGYMAEPKLGTKLATYYEGYAVATLEGKYGVCGGCGRDHFVDNLNADHVAASPKEEKTDD